MADSPKETIISIARENRAWRWITVWMSICVAALSLVSYQMWRRQVVWMVTEDGRIANSQGKNLVFPWEASEAALQAIETYYTEAPNRETLLDAFFSEELSTAGKKHKPRDRFVFYRIRRVEPQESGVTVTGILYRENEKEEKLSLIMKPAGRNDMNPFGLVISSASGGPSSTDANARSGQP
jgi:hypothetical protein